MPDERILADAAAVVDAAALAVFTEDLTAAAAAILAVIRRIGVAVDAGQPVDPADVEKLRDMSRTMNGLRDRLTVDGG